MSPESLITLYHSTDRKGLEAARETGKLFGIEKLRKNRSGSGSNLTPDREGALAFIRAVRAGGRWHPADGAPELFLLTFIIPTELVKFADEISHSAGGWATTLTVDVDMLPDQYLQNLRGGTEVMTRDYARRKVLCGDIRFYEMPMDYLTSVEPVEYEYKGVKYPLNSSA